MDYIIKILEKLVKDRFTGEITIRFKLGRIYLIQRAENIEV
jgi:hypothetical protein